MENSENWTLEFGIKFMDRGTVHMSREVLRADAVWVLSVLQFLLLFATPRCCKLTGETCMDVGRETSQKQTRLRERKKE